MPLFVAVLFLLIHSTQGHLNSIKSEHQENETVNGLGDGLAAKDEAQITHAGETGTPVSFFHWYQHVGVTNDSADDDSLASRNLLLSTIEKSFDADHDGVLTTAELKLWMRAAQKQLVDDQVKRQFAYFSEEGTDVSYDALLDNHANIDIQDRNRRRFLAADENNDYKLNLFEFKSYLYPSDDILIGEASKYLDADDDGSLSLQEVVDKLGDIEVCFLFFSNQIDENSLLTNFLSSRPQNMMSTATKYLTAKN